MMTRVGEGSVFRLQPEQVREGLGRHADAAGWGAALLLLGGYCTALMPKRPRDRVIEPQLQAFLVSETQDSLDPKGRKTGFSPRPPLPHPPPPSPGVAAGQATYSGLQSSSACESVSLFGSAP